MKAPGGMDDLKRLTDRTAGELLATLEAFRKATVNTPAQAAVAVRDSGRRNPSTGRAVRPSTVVGTGESAVSAAEDALREAADAVRTVYSEFLKAGVPEGAEW